MKRGMLILLGTCLIVGPMLISSCAFPSVVISSIALVSELEHIVNNDSDSEAVVTAKNTTETTIDEDAEPTKNKKGEKLKGGG